uniref:Methyltransferase FkbM domain-containing protein n=1 Tax=Timema tahoe TaxID=61484 RepID=A0A7R9FL25_9NEOP|nr:unnamed protein product [Timema tahoe]
MKDGTFLESGAYRNDRPSDTEWLEQELGWHGLLIQPDPMDYLTLRKHHRRNSKTLHGCLSPTPYPKEVTFRQGAKGISLKPNTNETKHGQKLLTRVKCFPLYSLLLATNLSKLDYLSLDADGAELQDEEENMNGKPPSDGRNSSPDLPITRKLDQVLRTVPMLRVDINVINVRCHNRQEKPLIDFMLAHNYRLQVVSDHAYIFVHKMVKV